ncbi:MAG TPA: hypothetical protein VJ851_05010 [Jatrophihabitans sp.]|nr:hypothetical protein [Jatrophihabitans sp.]
MLRAVATWPIWRIPRAALILVFTVDICALIIPALSPATISRPNLEIAAVLMSLSITYSAVTRRFERARHALHIGAHPVYYQNMLGVWTFAAAALLPLRLVSAVVLVAAIAEWPSRKVLRMAQPYRYIYSTAAALLAATSAHACVDLKLPFALCLAVAVPSYVLVGITCVVLAMLAVHQRTGYSGLLRPKSHLVELFSIMVAIIQVGLIHLQLGMLVWLSLPAAVAMQRYTTRAKLRLTADDSVTLPMGEDSWLIAATEVVAALPVVSIMRVNTADPAAASAVAQMQAGCDAIGYAGKAGLAVLLVDCPDRNAEALAARLRTALKRADVQASVATAAKPRDGYSLDDLLAVCEAELIARDAANRSVNRSAKRSRPDS